MQINPTSPVQSHARLLGALVASGTLWLSGSHGLAQSDPFKKNPGAAAAAPRETQAFAVETLQEIADRATPGVLGVAVCDLQTGALQGLNLSRPFSLQSVLKAFLAAAVLSEVDAGKFTLEKPVTVAPGDVRDEWWGRDDAGGTYSVRDLLRTALIDSGSTAADALLRLVGGPETVTAWLRTKGIEGVRIDRDLRTLGRDESGIPADLAPGKNASALEEQIAKPARQAAFKAAQADPRDTATPEGTIRFLEALKKGQLLSPASTGLLLGWMQEARTGPGRLRAGFSAATTLAHKTGTSPTFEGVTLATNDIGLATLPDGRTLAIAAFLADSAGSAEANDAILAACARVAAQPK